ncbi:hypothetical protein J437_LFUL010215 [Ladona fulva]|uniref:SEFIR domain-containing protein n=1 Tax=Ladona fulva TaxID=123851 RepID=A0A8K0KA72_LADFU|nr:hypothetical protein J437_LFUL010215 [Ladona fulva]
MQQYLQALVDDVRCGWDSVIEHEKCIWNIMEEVEDCFHDVPEVNLNSMSAFSISLVIIITIILLFFTGVTVFMFKRRSPMIPSLDVPVDETLPMVTKKKVLLLYARDCKQFMTVMKSFGQLLEKSHNIKVFDCYYDEDVLDGPLDWLQNKLTNPQFYVLIVTTRCAYLHQEAILAGDWGDSYSLYREPSFLDRVFMYGLKWVMKDISANPFSRSYIIGFRGFSRDEDMLSLPTNWRRYIIPDHLDNFFTDMDIYCTPVENIRNSVQHVNLESDIHSLCRYKSENPYYLSGILRSAGVLNI